LRHTFDTIAERYARARPGYPPELVADLVRLSRLAPDRRVLEIGPGTGQLTVPLAGSGSRIVAVELGADLAEAARDRLAGFPTVEVVHADVERWTPPAERFDLVLAATAFHWLDPDRRMDLVAGLLRPGGALGVVHTHHIAGGTEPLFTEVQECYLRFDPATPVGFQLSTAAEIDVVADPSEVFGPPEIFEYEWEETYRTGAYLDLLGTYSSTLSLPPPAAAGLLTCIGDRIDRRYGGTLTMRYLTRMLYYRLAG
jgi:SAM-dependent methyltransferase